MCTCEGWRAKIDLLLWTHCWCVCRMGYFDVPWQIINRKLLSRRSHRMSSETGRLSNIQCPAQFQSDARIRKHFSMEMARVDLAQIIETLIKTQQCQSSLCVNRELRKLWLLLNVILFGMMQTALSTTATTARCQLTVIWYLFNKNSKRESTMNRTKNCIKRTECTLCCCATTKKSTRMPGHSATRAHS